ncbi:Hypothetical protein I596_1408 [Dokdonella koreensis DS-123]|uniref:Uncharacterized protein n=1 Tax=Dokdonella koreensis DS-123 TaxID=1300342 RepID=A0A161HJR0_9GAMM|nr:Hypothetical protein I596_1408 [Dokdonella koreensis DS-123]
MSDLESQSSDFWRYRSYLRADELAHWQPGKDSKVSEPIG